MSNVSSTARVLHDLKVTVTCHCGQKVEHEQWCSAVPKLIPDEQRRLAWNLIEDFVAGHDVESEMDVWRAIILLRHGA